MAFILLQPGLGIKGECKQFVSDVKMADSLIREDVFSGVAWTEVHGHRTESTGLGFCNLASLKTHEENGGG